MADQGGQERQDGQDGRDRTDDFAAECLSKWTPRFVANGIDYNDLGRLRERIDGWADWRGEFVAVGEEHVALGEAAEDRGDLESAGEHFARASMYHHFGSHVWHVDEAERDATHRRAVELFRRGGEYLDPPVQRIEAPYPEGGFDVPGNLRVPEHGPNGPRGPGGSDGPGAPRVPSDPGALGDDSPLVVLLPGSDSIKEELSAYDSELHQRGLATLAVDGAGQGETRNNQGMGTDYPALITAMIDHVRELDPAGVDVSRIGVYGVSLGGFYAPYVAAHDDRFDACVGISGKFTVGPVSGWATDMHRTQYLWATKADSLVELDEITEAMTLRDCIGDLIAPSLAVTGAHDVITAPEQTERIARGAPNGEFLCYPDGNHVCNNIPYTYRPRVADWLREQLA